MSNTETLNSIPDLKKVMRRIVAGAVPAVGTKHVADADPSTHLEVHGVSIERAHLATYTRATGLRLGNEVPITYLYVLSFPLTMELMSRSDFPFAPVGAVHVANEITQLRPVGVDENFTVRTHAENLRPHRKGLLIDIITTVTPDNETEPVWSQTSTFLGQGARFASSAPVALTTRGRDDARPLDFPDVPDHAAIAQWRFSRNNVRAYVEASGDSNPIHTSNLGAKAFGFPAVIAHGMLSAAAALRLVDGRWAGPLRYTVEFHKPIVIPARVAAWAEPDDNGFSLQLRQASKPEKLHLNARLDRIDT
ncbi:MaoC family dehydratase [Corynebacterium mayonis]|uniref:MaoC family dehydratase n=1 Tax=Corynebacterium mayonis TaxID=3062461 RepID=UPI00313FFE3D